MMEGIGVSRDQDANLDLKTPGIRVCNACIRFYSTWYGSQRPRFQMPKKKEGPTSHNLDQTRIPGLLLSSLWKRPNCSELRRCGTVRPSISCKPGRPQEEDWHRHGCSTAVGLCVRVALFLRPGSCPGNSGTTAGNGCVAAFLS